MPPATEPPTPAAPASAAEASGGPAAVPDDTTPKLARFRLLIAFARPHRRMLLLGLLLAIGSSATQLATPMVTRDILTALAESRSMSGAVLLLAGLVVVGAAAGLIMWITLGTVGERIVLDARIQADPEHHGAAGRDRGGRTDPRARRPAPGGVAGHRGSGRHRAAHT